MVALLILILSTVLGSYFLGFKEEWYDKSDKILFAILGAAVSFLIGILIIFLISGILGVYFPLEPILIENEPLLALNGLTSVEGNFFLGIGSIKGDMEYYYLDDIIICNSNNPQIEKYRYEFKNKFLSNNFYCFKNDFYKVYIPSR
jgi:ABC-type dipeptide/oligopeptide/nickel transport system permease component